MIFATLNQKGGVGKTTTAVTFAEAARRAGYRVLLADLDSQANCSDALGIESAPDVFDVLVKGLPVDKLAYEARPGLFVLRSDKTNLEAETIITARSFGEYLLPNALEGLEYDLIFLDCAPSLHALHTSAMVAADYLIIPTELAQYSIKGVIEVERSLNTIHKVSSSNCQIGGILPTKLNRAEDETHAQLANLAEAYGPLVWPPIPTDAKVKVANRRGLTLQEYAPKTPALIGYRDGKNRIGGYNQAFERLLKLL